VGSTKFRHSVSTEVARLLKQARESRGLSKTRLAEEAGISQGMITYIESEERNPSLDILLRLTEALEIKLSELIKKAERNTVGTRKPAKKRIKNS
jgi:transcriptional regulator with XRE-family HTH domain